MNAIWDISSKAGLNLGTVGLIEQVGHLTAWLMDWPKSRSAEAVPQQASCQEKKEDGRCIQFKHQISATSVSPQGLQLEQQHIQRKDKEMSNHSSYFMSYPSTTHLNSYAKAMPMNQMSALVGIVLLHLHSVFSIPRAKLVSLCQLHNMHGKNK